MLELPGHASRSRPGSTARRPSRARAVRPVWSPTARPRWSCRATGTRASMSALTDGQGSFDSQARLVPVPVGGRRQGRPERPRSAAATDSPAPPKNTEGVRRTSCSTWPAPSAEEAGHGRRGGHPGELRGRESAITDPTHQAGLRLQPEGVLRPDLLRHRAARPPPGQALDDAAANMFAGQGGPDAVVEGRQLGRLTHDLAAQASDGDRAPTSPSGADRAAVALAAAPGRAARRAARPRLELALLLLPALTLFGLFVVYPIGLAVYDSLYNWNGFGPLERFRRAAQLLAGAVRPGVPAAPSGTT